MLRIVSFFSFAILFFSCKNAANKESSVYNELDNGLERARAVVELSSDEMYRKFYKQVNDPVTGSLAKRFLSEVEMLKHQTDSMIQFVKYFQNGLAELSESDVERTAGNLHSRLLDYRNAVAGVSEDLRNYIIGKNNYPLTGIDSSKNNFIKNHFRNKTSSAIKSMLNKFETDIRLLENDCISFENIRMSGCVLTYTSFSTIVGQSSNILKAGDTIQIMAGVGEFTKVCMPQIFVNNKKVEINEGAVAVYKLKISSKPGNYSIPVLIKFTKPDGTMEVTKSVVEYTVKN